MPEVKRATQVYVDPGPDKRGQVLTLAVLENGCQIALTFNAN